MICPRCGARQYGAAARCNNCDRDLLPGRSPRSRYAGLLISLAGAVAFVILLLALDRLDFAPLGMGVAAILVVVALPLAVVPVSMADRYRRRAREDLQRDPLQALRDLTRALELAPDDRAILLERARVLRVMGRDPQAAADLRTYLNSARGEPRNRVLRARLLLQYIEAGPPTAGHTEPPRIKAGA